MSSIPALHPITRRSLLSGAAATSALILLHPFAARAAANQAHLRIMETTDIHVHVFPYDYYGDKPNDTLGLARHRLDYRRNPRRGRQFLPRR